MKKKKLTQVLLEVSIHLRYFYQDKAMRREELLEMYSKLSKAVIYRQAKKPVSDKTVDNKKHNHGRPRKISPPKKCLILRQIFILWEQYGSFTIKQLRVSAGVRKDVSYFYILEKTVCWKWTISKKGVDLPVNSPNCWMITSRKKLFHSILMLLGFSISTTLRTRCGQYELWHDD